MKVKTAYKTFDEQLAAADKSAKVLFPPFSTHLSVSMAQKSPNTPMPIPSYPALCLTAMT